MEDIDIRKYAGVMRELDLTGLEVTENGATLRLERSFAAAVPAMAPVSPVRPPQAESAAAVSNDSVTEIRSPMVGVFYSSPKDNEPPFVKAGDAVRKGDVLCIIEAMKDVYKRQVVQWIAAYDTAKYDYASDSRLGNNPGSLVYRAEAPLTGEENGMVLADLRGKSYYDPMWDLLLNQLTFSDAEELRRCLFEDAYHTGAVKAIGKPETLERDGPQDVYKRQPRCPRPNQDRCRSRQRWTASRRCSRQPDRGSGRGPHCRYRWYGTRWRWRPGQSGVPGASSHPRRGTARRP